MGQLDPAAADPGVIAAAHIERRILGDLVAGLVNLGIAGKHQPCHHQSLCARAAFGEPALDQQLVDTALGGFGGA